MCAPFPLSRLVFAPTDDDTLPGSAPLLKAASGVHSLPDKKTNFSYADQLFEGETKYSDWQFIYTFQMTSKIPVTK